MRSIRLTLIIGDSSNGIASVLPVASCPDLAQCRAPCEQDRMPTVPLQQSSSLDCGSEPYVLLESTDTRREARPATANVRGVNLLN